MRRRAATAARSAVALSGATTVTAPTSAEARGEVARLSEVLLGRPCAMRGASESSDPASLAASDGCLCKEVPAGAAEISAGCAHTAQAGNISQRSCEDIAFAGFENRSPFLIMLLIDTRISLLFRILCSCSMWKFMASRCRDGTKLCSK